MIPDLMTWAARHGVTPQALNELRQLFCCYADKTPGADDQSEAAVQQLVRLEASRAGARLFRNNVGAFQSPDTGAWVRYGLANESVQMNRMIKSSDLVGLRPVVITPQHVGSVIGQFVAREVKRSGWRYTGNTHEKAQLRFLQLVASLGGDACFCNGEGSFYE